MTYNNSTISLNSIAGTKKAKIPTKKQLKSLVENNVTELNTKVSILEQLLHGTMMRMQSVVDEGRRMKNTVANLLDLMTIRLSALSKYLVDKKFLDEEEIKAYISASTKEVNDMRESLVDRDRGVKTVDRPANKDDTVVINFQSTIDGKPFEGGTAFGQYLRLGSGTFIANFEDQLVGVKAGEKRTVSVKFPDDYQEESLKGKDSKFEVLCLKVKEDVESVSADVPKSD
jgi:trigger factor